MFLSVGVVAVVLAVLSFSSRTCGGVELRSPWWIAVAVAFVLLALIISAFAGGALRWMLVGCAVSSLLVLVVGWVVMVTEDQYDDVLAEVLDAYTGPDSAPGGTDVEFLPADLRGYGMADDDINCVMRAVAPSQTPSWEAVKAAVESCDINASALYQCHVYVSAPTEDLVAGTPLRTVASE